jgi:hypothetical protein
MNTSNNETNYTVSIDNLMVNDWASINGQFYRIMDIKKSGHMKLYEIHKGYELSPEFNSSYLIKFIQPIELTADIFKKIGWSSMSNYIVFDTDNWYIKLGEWLADNNITKDIKMTLIPHKSAPKYVHELQHLFKLLNIDKNIDIV